MAGSCATALTLNTRQAAIVKLNAWARTTRSAVAVRATNVSYLSGGERRFATLIDFPLVRKSTAEMGQASSFALPSATG